MRAQRGISILMVIVVLAILVTALLALMAFTRLSDSDADRNTTQLRLQKAAEAVDQFAAVQHRLPCAADPNLDTGIEAITAVGSATCMSVADEGTLPWKTLGLVHDDGYDAWGDKISYRVYTGNKGSLVQPEGVNMTQCDTTEPSSGNTTSGSGAAGGLCVSNADPTLRSTSADNFLAGKGLSLNEYGVDRPNVAYLVMSHGATGYGAFTISGARKSYGDVKGDEAKNTNANGPFTIRAFSGSDVEANTNPHFDDMIVYRTLPDLVNKIGLQARDWPDDVVGSSLLTAAALTASGHAPVSGDTQTTTATLGNVAITSFGGNIGVAPAGGPGTAEGIGIAGGGTAVLISDASGTVNGAIGFTYPRDATHFAFTLTGFGTSGGYAETVAVFLYDSHGAAIASIFKSGCNPDGGMASFSLDTVPFRSARIVAQPSRNAASAAGPTSFVISEVIACGTDASTCNTTLSNPANTCP